MPKPARTLVLDLMFCATLGALTAVAWFLAVGDQPPIWVTTPVGAAACGVAGVLARAVDRKRAPR